MCFADPVSLGLATISGGIGAAGGMAEQRAKDREARLNSWANIEQMKQDSEVAKLRNKILGEYVGRQNEFVGQNREALKDTTAQFSGPQVETNRATSEADRNAFLQKQVGTTPQTDVAVRESASPLVQGEMAAKLMEAFKASQAGGQREAKLGSFGDSLRIGGEAAQNSARKIDTTNNFARGDISLLGADQDLQEFQVRKPIYKPGANPNNPAGTLKGLGSLVGSLAGAYGNKAVNSLSSIFK